MTDADACMTQTPIRPIHSIGKPHHRRHRSNREPHWHPMLCLPVLLNHRCAQHESSPTSSPFSASTALPRQSHGSVPHRRLCLSIIYLLRFLKQSKCPTPVLPHGFIPSRIASAEMDHLRFSFPTQSFEGEASRNKLEMGNPSFRSLVDGGGEISERYVSVEADSLVRDRTTRVMARAEGMGESVLPAFGFHVRTEGTGAFRTAIKARLPPG